MTMAPTNSALAALTAPPPAPEPTKAAPTTAGSSLALCTSAARISSRPARVNMVRVNSAERVQAIEGPWHRPVPLGCFRSLHAATLAVTTCIVWG